MAIKSVSKEDVVFVPAYSGNREDSNPLTVTIHPMNRADADTYAKKTRYFQRPGSKGEWDSNALSIQKKQFTDNVKSVSNFLDSDTGAEITDVERFYDEAPHPLIEEILEAILDVSRLQDTEIKNS